MELVAQQQNVFLKTIGGQGFLKTLGNTKKESLPTNAVFTFKNCRMTESKKKEMLHSAGIIETNKLHLKSTKSAK